MRELGAGLSGSSTGPFPRRTDHGAGVLRTSGFRRSAATPLWLARCVAFRSSGSPRRAATAPRKRRLIAGNFLHRRGSRSRVVTPPMLSQNMLQGLLHGMGSSYPSLHPDVDETLRRCHNAILLGVG